MTGLHKFVPTGSAWFVLLLLLNAMSCSAPVEIPPLVCPPPPVPVCSPGTFNQTLLDTVLHLGHVQSHITMLPVPPNSGAEDYAMAFIPDASGEYIALLTSNRASVQEGGSAMGTQRVFSARLYSTTHFGPLKDVNTGDAPLPLGAAFYSKADGLLYFSAKANNDDPDDYDLYSATVQVSGDVVTLSNTRALTGVNAEGHFDSQPTLDAIGTHLYFVSDRPGGDGGTDIWYAERTSATSNEWSSPQPLPEPVNSACDELSPFILASDPNTLYFASNGHETVGGYDLFKTHITNGRFSEPENLGKPINTTSDEVFPSLLNDTAFFWSSNVPANVAGMNLYTITRTFIGGHLVQAQVPEPGRIETQHLQMDTSHPAPPVVLGPVEIIAHVTRGADNRPAIGADIYVHKDSLELYRGMIPESGMIGFKVNRDAEYDVGAETEETFFDVRHVDLRGFKDSVIHVDLHLPDTLVIRINFPFDDYEHPYEFTIDDNGQPSSMTWQKALDLTGHSALRSMSKLRELLLIGNTDSLGTDAYNNRLGRERAQFVASELEKRGIPKEIVRVESRGRTDPVVRRLGESDEIFRLRSRRVEFIKVFQ